MDGREAMALSSGSHQYYIHRGGVPGGAGSGMEQKPWQTGGLHPPPPGYRPSSNPNYPGQSNARTVSVGSAFAVEPSNANFGHGTSMVVPSGIPVSEPVKKKRGRPRKYAPDGQVTLGFSPLPVKPKHSSEQDPNTPKRNRGRPPGTGRKQRLALLGEWMNNSAGLAFAPHIIRIGVGEDVVGKILAFSQQRPRAVCVLSGTGTVSSVTLRQPGSSGPSVTYEGRFEILCLSGSYLVAEDGGPRNRTGGISASLSSSDGYVIGGAMAMLIAASPVQVVVCSFVYGASKSNSRPVGRPKSEKNSAYQSNEEAAIPKSSILTSPPPTQNFTPMSTWPGARVIDLRNPHADIDLTRG